MSNMGVMSLLSTLGWKTSPEDMASWMYVYEGVTDWVDPTFVSYLVGCICAGIGLIAFLLLIRPRTITADPDEWLLITKNDRIVKAGKGISAFQWWGRKHVKFASKHERLEFSISTLTKENQGVRVQGHAIWKISEQGNGPEKYYRNTKG